MFWRKKNKDSTDYRDYLDCDYLSPDLYKMNQMRIEAHKARTGTITKYIAIATLIATVIGWFI